MRRKAWLLSGLALLPVAGHTAGGGWGNGGGSTSVDSAARAAAASALTLAQGSTQQSRNLSDLANASAALGNLGGIPTGLIGAASGVAALNASRMLPASQIPFGTATGTVADGGALTAASAMASSALQPGGNGSGLTFAPGGSGTATTGAALAALASSAIPSSMLGTASGIATLDGSKHVAGAQIPFGTTAGSVADGGTLAATSTLAGAAIPSSLIGAASGLASLDGSKHLVSAQIPFGTTAGSVADGGTLAATSTLAGAAIPSSMLGTASGVATLDGSKHVVSAQIPFGTATGSVADGGAFTTALQNVAITFLKIGSAESGVVHVLGLGGVAETFGRTLAQRAGDVWNIADHGADGTALGANGNPGDNTALQNGLVYASGRSYTVVTAPAGSWPLLVSSTQPGFAIPSNTLFQGAGNNGTIFTWNDRNTGGYSLFVSPSLANGARNTNVVMRDVVVQGGWGPCSGCTYADATIPIFLGGTDDITLDHVVSRYSGGFGLTVRGSTNVKLIDDAIFYSKYDGINLDDDSGIYAEDFNVQHTADDCFSAHSDIYDQGGVRRNIQIIGGLCFDTHSIDIASPVSVSITGTIIDTFKVSAISLSGAGAGAGNSEGLAEGQDVTIDNVTMTNGINTKNSNANDPANFDPNDPTDATLNYIIVGARSARAGSLTYVPGENGTSPYPYTLNNSQSASIPVPAWRTFRIINSTFGRHFGASNTAAIPNWASFSQGGITTRDGIFNPSLTEGDLLGPAITIFSPNYMRNLTITGNTFEGLGTALYMPSGSGHMADFQFDYNRMIDMRYNCLDVEFLGIVGDISDNLCNADPYFASGNRGSIGNWANNGALTGFIITVPGLTVQRNAFENVSNDTNVNTADPTTGDLFRDNTDYANPQTVGSYNIYNGGIGNVSQAGFRLIQIGTNPSDPSWDKVLNVPVEAAPAQPTTGFWMPGEFVRNSAPSSSNTASGWLRVTLSNNGSTYPYAAPTNNVAGTDWLAK